MIHTGTALVYHVPWKGGVSLRSQSHFPGKKRRVEPSWPPDNLHPGDPIVLHKLNAGGELRMRYPGRIINCTNEQLRILAHWTETGTYRHFSMRRGDPVCEHFFPGHWHNLLTLWDGKSATLRGWYADICRPPVLRAADEGWLLQYEDLTLDAFVDPGLTMTLIDGEEFRQCTLPQLYSWEIRACLDAVCRLAELSRRGRGPFAQVPKRFRARRINDRPSRSHPK